MKPVAVVLAGCGLASSYAIRPPHYNKPSFGKPVQTTQPVYDSSGDQFCTVAAPAYANKYAKWRTVPCTTVTPTSVAPSSVPSSVVPSSVISSVSVSIPSSVVPSSLVPSSISVSIPSSVVPSSVVPSSLVPSSISVSVPSVVPSSVVPSSISVSVPSSIVPSSVVPSSVVPSSISVSVPVSSVIPSISISIPISSVVPSSVVSSVVPSSSIVQPPVQTCELGTAFGYQEGDSVTLNTQPGQGCNRWGWYETPTLAELQSGISGTLYVGAGGNNINNAINVGVWTAVASPTGGVTVTYALDAGYFLAEAHIDLDCLPIDTCAPGQYTFNSGALPNLPVYVNPTPLQYPTCSGGSQAYLILHGSVNYITTSPTCAPPVAS